MGLKMLGGRVASAVVRLRGSGRDLVAGLRALRLPDLFVYSLDHTLALLGGAKKSRRGRAEPAAQGGALSTVKRLLRGDIGRLADTKRNNNQHARERPAARHDSRRPPPL